MLPDDAIRAAILDLADRRGTGRTFCPSEVARILSPEDWRGTMPDVRRVADILADEGRLAVTSRGRRVPSAMAAHGPVRLGLPAPSS